MRRVFFAGSLVACLLATKADSTIILSSSGPSFPCSGASIPCLRQHATANTTFGTLVSSATFSLANTQQANTIVMEIIFCDTSNTGCGSPSLGTAVTSIVDMTTGRTCNRVPSTTVELGNTVFYKIDGIWWCGAGTSNGTFTYTVNFSTSVPYVLTFHQEFVDIASSPNAGIGNTGTYPSTMSGSLVTNGNVTQTNELIIGVFQDIFSSANVIPNPSTVPPQAAIETGVIMPIYNLGNATGSAGVVNWQTAGASNVNVHGAIAGLLHP